MKKCIVCALLCAGLSGGGINVEQITDLRPSAVLSISSSSDEAAVPSDRSGSLVMDGEKQESFFLQEEDISSVSQDVSETNMTLLTMIIFLCIGLIISADSSRRPL